MPLIVALGAALLVLLAAIALLPLSLVQRYRMGTSRQLARRWLTAINVTGISLSAILFLGGAALTSIWVPAAFTYTVLGMAAGCLLGVAGLALTRWERTTGALHYTPNRWLVLTITVVVTGRILYGFWRAWDTWRSAPDHMSWVVQSGAAGSLAAGAVVLGYYLAYWLGVRRRLKRHASSSGSIRR